MTLNSSPKALLPARQREAHHPHGPSDVMDSGPGGMWYFYRRGSGVWLRTGRMKTAPGKNAMLASLLSELTLHPRLKAQWKHLAERLGLFVNIGAGQGGRSDRQRLEATSQGRTTCAEAGIVRCRDYFLLDDSWDDPITWAGRALGYDTLLFSATLLPSSVSETDAITFVSAYPEIVDLRVPDPEWTMMQPLGAHPYLEDDPTEQIPLHARRKTPAAASRWMRAIRDEGLLSLRDPLDPLNSGRARPCNFSLGPTAVLRCAGHSPTRWKALPVMGAWDTCSVAMCGHNDLHWREPSSQSR